MSRYSRLAGIVAAAVLASLSALPAQAQATRTWISGVGNDADPCSRTAPCKTWAGAFIKTAAGGEIDCLDPGGFGGVTLTHSITLDCGGGMGGQVGSILVASTNGITVNAGAGDKIKIRNMSIDGLAAAGFPGVAGIRFNSGAVLTVEHVSIFGFGASASPAIDFEPAAAGSKLFTRDVEVRDNLGTGILVQPVGAVAASAVLDNTTITDNNVGLQAKDGATVTVMNCNVSGNVAKGVVLVTAGTAGFINLFNTVVASNGGIGVQATGATSTVTLTGSGLYNNVAGIFPSSGAVISFTSNSFGTNAGNTGGATTTVPSL